MAALLLASASAAFSAASQQGGARATAFVHGSSAAANIRAAVDVRTAAAAPDLVSINSGRLLGQCTAMANMPWLLLSSRSNLLSPDFLYEADGSTLDKAQFMDTIGAIATAVPSLDLQPSDLKVVSKDKVTFKAHLNGVVEQPLKLGGQEYSAPVGTPVRGDVELCYMRFEHGLLTAFGSEGVVEPCDEEADRLRLQEAQAEIDSIDAQVAEIKQEILKLVGVMGERTNEAFTKAEALRATLRELDSARFQSLGALEPQVSNTGGRCGIPAVLSIFGVA